MLWGHKWTTLPSNLKSLGIPGGLDVESVNVARKLLFAQNQKIERIPPTADALLQHAKRAIYQTGKDLFLIKFELN